MTPALRRRPRGLHVAAVGVFCSGLIALSAAVAETARKLDHPVDICFNKRSNAEQRDCMISVSRRCSHLTPNMPQQFERAPGTARREYANHSLDALLDRFDKIMRPVTPDQDAIIEPAEPRQLQ